MDTAHVAFLRDRYQAALYEAATKGRDQFRAREGKLTASSLFDAFVDADPSRDKEYLEWMLRRYAMGSHRHPVQPKDRLVWIHPDTEELARLKEALAAFHFHRDGIDPGKRDIHAHADEHSIWAAVAPLAVMNDGAAPAGSPFRIANGKALSETDIVYSGKGWTLLLPRTMEAADWWGKGTCWGKWRTSSIDEVYADCVAQRSLFVGIGPRGKFQFHTGDYEGRDGEGFHYSVNHLLKGAPKSLWDALGKLTLPRLDASPSSDHSERTWMERLPLEWLRPVWDKAPATVMRRMPEKSIGKLSDMPDDFFLRAFEQDTLIPLLSKVPPERRTEKVCRAAVSINAWNLGSVPEDLKTPDMFIAARTGSRWSLDMVEKFAPGKFTDDELRVIALSTIPHSLPGDIGFLPARLLDDAVLRAALERNGECWWVKYIPQESRGDSGAWLEIYGRMLGHSPGSYGEIPARVRRTNPEFFVKAVSLDPGLFHKWQDDVGPRHRAEAIEAALEASKDALLPLRDHLTPERVMFALAHHPGAIGSAREIGYTGREYVERALEAADTPEKAHDVVWADWHRISQDDGLLEVAMARLSVEDRETLEGRLSPAGRAI